MMQCPRSGVLLGIDFLSRLVKYTPTVDLLTRDRVVPLEGTQGVYRPKISSSLRTYGGKHECAAQLSSVSVRCSTVRLSRHGPDGYLLVVAMVK